MKILDMKIHWPEVKIPEEFNDAESYLRHLVYLGAKKKYVDDDGNSENLREERIKHIEHELEALKGYEPYIILSYDLVNFCRAEGIMVSPGVILLKSYSNEKFPNYYCFAPVCYGSSGTDIAYSEERSC